MGKRTSRAITLLLACAWMRSCSAQAVFSFQITAVFSDPAGLYQFIQLTEVLGQDDQQHFTGLQLVSTSRSGVVKRFTFPNDLPDGRTRYEDGLIATASINSPRDFEMPDGFVPTEPGASLAIVDPNRPDTPLAGFSMPNGLPTDGLAMLTFDGSAVRPAVFHRFHGAAAFNPVVQRDPVIEYYNATLDHYFVTMSQPDIDALDSGRIAGWTRTGYAFGTWINRFQLATSETDLPPLDSMPVCRLYIPPTEGDSHFFSASPAECAAAIAQHPEFDLETSQAFLAVLPDPVTGACHGVNVYRLWNGRADSNHRYTTSTTVRDAMIAKGYILEGYGRDPVTMCVDSASYFKTSGP